MAKYLKQWVRAFGGIYLTVFLLASLFLLVLFATFAQVDFGIYEANQRYFSSWFVWMDSIPIFLGGYSIGLLLVVNLILSHATKFKFKFNYLGIFLIHFGLILLIFGSGVTSFFGQEMQIDIKEKSTKSYVIFPTLFEFVIIDQFSNTTKDLLYVYSIDQLKKGVSFKGIEIKLTRYYENAIINQRGIESLKYSQLGQFYKLISLPKTYKMDERNVPGFELSLTNNSRLDYFIFWGGSSIYQELNIDGQKYLFKLRPKRKYLPFSLYLKDFVKTDYQGTDTPQQFISYINLNTYEGEIPYKIEMNHPLRYNGYTFFQSSFTEDETTSVFQVVKNPSWQIPYLSSLLIVIGLFIQMIISMKRTKP
ncbi:MAG: cytochrome c biogenesis protein ResB [Candidatus Margulisiibacteriota bacterium]